MFHTEDEALRIDYIIFAVFVGVVGLGGGAVGWFGRDLLGFVTPHVVRAPVPVLNRTCPNEIGETEPTAPITDGLEGMDEGVENFFERSLEVTQ